VAPTPTTVPAPGQAALPAPNVAALLRRNATDPAIADRPAVLFGDQSWTHRDFVAESCRWANLFLALRRPGEPFHVGVLLDNTPDYLLALGGAALVGATVVGLNHTRQGEHLARDITHTDLGCVITESRHLPRLEAIADDLPFGPERVIVSHRFDGNDRHPLVDGIDLEVALAGVPTDDPGLEPPVETHWALVFTSGTSDAPKAVICSQKRLLQTGTRMGIILGIGPDDIGYICMPLFHSNALMVGWAPSLVHGCAVGLARRFSASGWLPDVRRYGSTYFNYTGKPLSYLVATPEEPDDADNTLRIAFGNEGSPDVIETFSRRFGVEVIDAFGATEGGIAVNRDAPMKPGSMGLAGSTIHIVDEAGNDLAPAVFDAAGHLVNADGCVGEIVNTAGAGPFEGYYNNPEATERTTRNGWYWSGDLGYLDDERYLFFAGRNADWIRVDGENFPAGPIEDALAHHPDVVLAAVFGVPDEQSGDQVMAALLLGADAEFEPTRFSVWLDSLDAIGPKWRPRYVRLVDEFPTTGTNKIVKRTLVHQKFRRDRVGVDRLWVRARGDETYRPFGRDDESALHEAFVHAGRERFWDL
jgi:fatty-acyl-CoA synthase